MERDAGRGKREAGSGKRTAPGSRGPGPGSRGLASGDDYVSLVSTQPLRTATTATLVAVTAGHFVNDAFTALLTPLLPALRESFGVSIAQAALLVAVSSFASSMLQPAFGLLADRSDRRLLAAAGPLVCGAMALLGFAPSFAALALVVAVSGLGSGAFHPAAVAFVHESATPRRRGLYAALFSAGGTAGLAVGPLVASGLGLARLHWMLPVGLLVTAHTWLAAPRTRLESRVTRHWREYAAVFRGPIRLLWATSVLRSLSTISYQALIGFALAARGLERHIGPSLAAFSLSAALGGIVGGLASDRLGRIRVLRSSVLLTVPFFVLLVYTLPTQWWYYPLTVLVGAMVNANIPVTVVAAQEYAPDHVATASALMMGFAWGTSGVLFTLVGTLADLTSPRTAMVAAILLLLPAYWLTLRLREPGEATPGS